MNRRTLGFVIFAVAVALGCVRLGFWQLSRLGERRARNAAIAARLDAPPESLATALADSASAEFRQVQLRGVFDYDHEIVYTSRTRRGSPGVQVITPMRMADGSAILVNRGWVYSPNGISVELAKWREGDSATVKGYLQSFVPPSSSGAVSTPSSPRAVRHLVHDSLVTLVPYRIASFVVMRRDGADDTGEVTHPFRPDLPALDEGPHKSYAIQWFSFALIGLIGTGAVLARSRTGVVPASAPDGSRRP